jgi:hypothetical protein
LIGWTRRLACSIIERGFPPSKVTQ